MTDSPDRWDRVRSILEQALELPTAAVEAFLDRECAGDAELRAEVESLITADREAPTFLDAPAFVPERPPGGGTLEGARLGPWRVLHEIGRGGMGVVHLGERADGQFEQRVAVKVLQQDARAADLGARLRTERRILGTLDHRGIVRILDGGVVEDGRPYLVMEHIEGERIDTWCDSHGLAIPARLRLFVQVLDAVAYAHRALVVHRDLKPDNILVTDTGEVRLLDFGIAKLLAAADDGEAMPTRTGMRPLTPEYAAPEQIRGEPITTACDIYSLGVLLFQLLTGRRPYARDAATPWEVERAVLETEPERPGAGIDADLEAIVLMALRKEPSERYGSADAFRADIERYLGSLPVLARRGSRAYHVRKFVRRHRAGVVVAAGVLLLILGSTAAIARSAAVAERARATAEREARTASEVTAFMIGLFEGSDPWNVPGDTVTARTLLRQGRERLERELTDEPVVRASLLHTLGRVHGKLGLTEVADTLLREALDLRTAHLGPYDVEVAATLQSIGNVHVDRRWWTDALDHYERALDIHARNDEAETKLPTGLLMSYARALSESGQADSALAVAGRALALDRARGDTISTDYLDRRIREAVMLRAVGRYDAASEVYADLLPRIARAVGEEHPTYATALNNAAYVLTRQERWAEAVPLYREASATARRTLGADHNQAWMLEGNLASALMFSGETDEAILLFHDRLRRRQEQFGDGHWRVAVSKEGIGRAYFFIDEFDEAERYFRGAVVSYHASLGVDHLWSLLGETRVILAMAARGDPRGPELLERALDRLTHAEFDPNTRGTISVIADDLDRIGLPQYAERFRALGEAPQ